MQKFIGTGVALVTPFNKDLSVDTQALTRLVNHVIDGGVEYLVVLGTTAESATLTFDEKELVVKTILQANNKRLPIVLGVGGNNTAEVLNELKTRNFDGIDAILSVSPFYNKPTQEGIYQHFKLIGENSPVPVIIYNVPGRTGSNVLPETVIRLAKHVKNIVAIKEAAGDIVQAMKIIQHKPEDFLVISGDDMITLPMTLAGGSGVISVIGQGYPKEFSQMVRLGLQHKANEAYNLHYKIADSVDMIFEEGNPAGIKEILKAINVCDNTLRLPLVNTSNDLAKRLNDFTKKIIS